MSIGLPSANTAVQEKGGRIGTPWYGFFQQLVNALLLQGTGTPGNIIIFGSGGSATDGGPVPISGINQLTGDVTAGPGDGSQVATIAAHAVTFAKTQQISTQMLVGRNTAGTGDEEQVTISQALDWLGP